MRHRIHGRHRLKLGAIFFVSILTLAGIGISYAGLHDVITIFGSVQSATIQFQDVTYEGTEINGMSMMPRAPYSNEYTLPPTGITFSKTFDVAVECNQLYHDQPEQIFNAWVNFTIETIPVIINHLSFYVIEENEWEWLGQLIKDGHVDLTMMVIRNNVPIEVDVGSQLHPGEDISIHLSLTLTTNTKTFDDDLELLVVKGYSGVMMIHLEVIQWTGPCEDDEVPGSDPECQTETAWGGNTIGDGWSLEDGNGGPWWFYYNTSGPLTQTIWADLTIDVGNVTVTDSDNGQVTIIIELTGGWKLQDDDEAVKIQGYNESELPSFKPSMGKHDRFYAGRDFTIESPFDFDYYAIHLDVQLCQD